MKIRFSLRFGLYRVIRENVCDVLCFCCVD